MHLTLDSEAPPSYGSVELNGTQKKPTVVSKHLALDEDDPPSHDSTDKNDEAELGSGSSCRKLNGWFVQRRSSDPCWRCYIRATKQKAYVDSIRHSFVTQHDSPSRPRSTDRLSCPIIFLQRRPEKKCRSFVRAYAPVFVSAIPRVHAHASQVNRRTLKALNAFHKRVSSYRHLLYGTQSTSHSSRPSFRACLR